MTYQGVLIKEPKLRWPIVLTAAIITAAIALVVAMLYYMAMTGPAARSYQVVPQLETALRVGNPEFEQVRHQIAIEPLMGTEKIHPFNSLAVEITGTIKNKTGRTLKGLEMRAAVLDRDEAAVRERTVVIIPAQQTVLEPDEAIKVRVLLENINKDSDRARLMLEVTGVSFAES